MNHRRDRFAAHILNRVLIAKPVRAFDGVVKVETPIVLAHITERGGNPALGGNGM